MTRLGRILRNLVERALNRYHEGPRPPARYRTAARAYRIMRPLSEAEQWEEFASSLAERAYSEGWTRGYEWAEREFPKGPDEAKAAAELEAMREPPLPPLLERPLTARQAAEQRDLETWLRRAARQGRVRFVPRQ